MREVCHDPQTGIRIREYIQQSFEFSPFVVDYENVDVWLDDPENPLNTPCPVGTFLDVEGTVVHQEWAKGAAGRAEYNARQVPLLDDRILFRLHRYDVYNIYRAFHAYISAYFTIKTLQLNQSRLQFVLTDQRLDAPRDEMMWNAMNHAAFPIIMKAAAVNENHRVVRAARVVRGSSAATSYLCSDRGPLHGKYRDSHCKSSAFRDAVAWLRDNFGPAISWSPHRPHRDNKIVIVWSSRRTFVHGSRTYHVSRELPRENDFFASLRERLDASTYILKSFNFGALDPPQAIEVASNADVMVGVHGAGMTWGAFLPRHGGLIEIHGGDRPPTNRHFHNIAAFADLHYRSLTLSATLEWTQDTVNQLARYITEMKLFSLSEEPAT